jgi:hypothetical protein
LSATEDLITVEGLVDEAAEQHLKVIARIDENPFSIGNKVAYHASYRNLYDLMLRWKAARDHAYGPEATT